MAFTSYYEAVNDQLETYATIDLIVETDADMIFFTQLLNGLTTEFAEAIWNNAL